MEAAGANMPGRWLRRKCVGGRGPPYCHPDCPKEHQDGTKEIVPRNIPLCRTRDEASAAHLPGPQASQEVASEIEERPAIRVVQLHWHEQRIYLRRGGASNGYSGGRWLNLTRSSGFVGSASEVEECTALHVAQPLLQAQSLHRRLWIDI